MAYRYTNTDKWSDQWFSDLKPTAKLLFMYLCDQCDIAGFLELNEKKIAFDTGIDKQGINKAMKEIEGRIIYSKNCKYIFVCNFIKHQKNFPLNKKNNAHKGIIERLEEKMFEFNFEDIYDFFKRGSEGAQKGLISPYGNGNSNGKEEKGVIGEKETKSENFIKFEKWIEENAINVSKLKEPFTDEEFTRLKSEYTIKQIQDVVKSMHNHKNLTKKYVSANLTFRNWAKREYGE